MGPFNRRPRGSSLSTVPPSIDTADYSPYYASLAASILYKSPLPSQNDLPVYILDSAALPDADEVTYDGLLPYVLARLPSDEQLIGGKGYEVVFFAGGEERPSDAPKKSRPGWSWFLQVYQILSRAMRKRLAKLYLVHERRWIRVMFEMFSTVVSPKFRRKVVHANTLSALALHIPLEDLLIPPSAYERDRRVSTEIYSPYATGKRAFGALKPLPMASNGDMRLPRVLRETSNFVLELSNVREEGLFRVNSRAKTVEILKEAYDRGQKFILWKDSPAVWAPTHFKEGYGDVTIEEIDPLEGYSVHNAAGLIKSWYSSLREPLFPQSSYNFVGRTFGGNDPKPIETPVFLDLVLQSADYSPLSRMSRLILTMHLFPLLSRIAAHSEQNKMTPRNLATCFAPSLLRGTDAIEDVKMSQVIARFLEFGISKWNEGLAERCSMGGRTFEEMLITPKNPADREDPLDSYTAETQRRNTDGGEQTHGITMLDHDESDSEADEPLLSPTQLRNIQQDGFEDAPPPLPPRVLSNTQQLASPTTFSPTDPLQQQLEQQSSPVLAQDPTIATISPTNTGLQDSSTATADGSIKRKPAPPLQQPPRYSVIVGPTSNDKDNKPTIDTSVGTNAPVRVPPDRSVSTDFQQEVLTPDSHVADGFRSQGFGAAGTVRSGPRTDVGDAYEVRSLVGSQRLPRYSEFGDDVTFTESPDVSRASTAATVASGERMRARVAERARGSLRKDGSMTERKGSKTETVPEKDEKEEAVDEEQKVGTEMAAAEQLPAANDIESTGKGAKQDGNLIDFATTPISPSSQGFSRTSTGVSLTRKPVGGRDGKDAAGPDSPAT